MLQSSGHNRSALITLFTGFWHCTLPLLFVASILSNSCVENEPFSIEVTATAQTDPVPSASDSADDIAVWIHPTDRAQSRIIATDKDSGLLTYNLAGEQQQYLEDGDVNNVDLRYGFALGDDFIDLVAASNRSDNAIWLYQIEPETGVLSTVHQTPIASGFVPYGLCLYQPLASESLFMFVTDRSSGQVKQWQLVDNGSEQIEATLVRSFDVGSLSEGCVADDTYSELYVGEEDVGIWRYDADPTALASVNNRELIDSTGANGQLSADVEGLAIYQTSGGGGYLIASSQGDDRYAVYERTGQHRFLGAFQIVASGSIDGAQESDGIEVVSSGLVGLFPDGLFIAHDGEGSAQENFKLVDWRDIALPADLEIDPSFTPR